MERKGFLINKAFKNYLWASILTVATSQIANIVDASLVGNIIGSEGLAAVVISMPILQAIYAISCFYVASCTMMAGMALGKGEKKKADSLFSFSLMISLVLGIVISVVGIIFIDSLLDLFCKSEEMRPMARSFMIVTVLSALPQLFMYTMEQFVTIDGSPKMVTRAVIVGNIVNLCMDFVFMKYLGTGIAGAGWATFLMYVVCCLIMLPHFRKKGTLRFNFQFSILNSQFPIRQMATLGMPLFLSTVLISVQYTCNNNIATIYIGEFGLIAYAICLQLFSFSMIILTGTLRTIQPIGAILKGIGDNRGIIMLLAKAYRFMAVGLVIYSSLIIFFPVQIAAFLGVTASDALPTIQQALPAFTLNIVMQALLYNLMPIYQFYGHNRIALFLSIGQTLLPVVGFWALAANSSLNPNLNPWFGFFLGQLVTAIILIACGEVVRRKHEGNQFPICLIPRGSENPTLELSFGRPADDMHKSFDEISQWLKNQNLDKRIIFKVRVIAEELMSNITRHSEQKDKNAYADVRIVVSSDAVTFSLSDSGIPFNPIENKNKGYGLMIANGAANEISYKYQFGQNMTTVKVNINSHAQNNHNTSPVHH